MAPRDGSETIRGDRHNPDDGVKIYRDSYGNDFSIPDLTTKQIQDAIPAHCFKRSTLRSLSYVARDLLLVGALGYAALNIHYIPYLPLRVAAWILYTYCQGLVFTGVWVLAHECGHGSFSASRTVCDTVGWTLHSALLVPYFSWKYSHSQHHKNTGRLEADTVHVPNTASDVARLNKFDPKTKTESQFHKLMEEAPAYTALMLVLQQLFGWPLYLLANVTGQKYGTWKANHFHPRAPFYNKSQYNAIVMSDIGLVLTAIALTVAVRTFGSANVLLHYVVPWIWCNHWLVFITYLQHTDPSLPHYRGSSWNFTRGAMATIDRDFGFIGRHIFHHITDTHVSHHLFSTIPFYRAVEATKGIKSVLKEHYMYDPSHFLVAFWRSARSCQWVPDSGEVVFFESAHGKPVAPKKNC